MEVRCEIGYLLTIIGILAGLEIIFLCFLAAWWLFFPVTVERARLRLDRTPWRCFCLGLAVALIVLPSIVVLIVLPLELTRVIGCLLLFILAAFTGIGAAGLTAAVGGRQPVLRPGNDASHIGELIHRSLWFEIAAGFWMGGVTTVILLPLVASLLDLNVKMAWLVGWSLLFSVLVLAGFGAAVSTARRGKLLGGHANGEGLTIDIFLRRAVTLELAAGFPFIGWFLIMPISAVTALGATVFALLRWMPGAAPVAGRDTGKKNIFVSFVALLWVLPPVIISVSVVAFFIRGAVALELASSLPVVGWFILVPLYIIVALGSTVFALLRWGGWWRRPLNAGRRE